jgi:alkylation response protein AidB-like acyl-CoA dehydrogenase
MDFALTPLQHALIERAAAVARDSLAPRAAAQKARFYREVVDGAQLFGSWGSEPERRGGASVGGTVIARRNGDWVIDGEKHFCTMAGAAHRYMVHEMSMALEGARPPGALPVRLPLGGRGRRAALLARHAG